MVSFLQAMSLRTLNPDYGSKIGVSCGGRSLQHVYVRVSKTLFECFAFTPRLKSDLVLERPSVPGNDATRSRSLICIISQIRGLCSGVLYKNPLKAPGRLW